MSIEILLGKSKSGKSKYIFDKIDKDIENGKDVTLFVPSQARVLAEENYMRMQNKEGIISLNITTISSYISEHLKSSNLYFDENYISKLDKKLILTKVILKNQNLFKIFDKVKSKPGFLELLNIYMDMFKKENVNIEEIENLELDNKMLEYKLKEIASVYKKYSLESEKYVGNVDEINLYVEKSLNQNNIDKVVYFDGYNNFTESEYLFIESLIKTGCNLIIALDTDITCKEDINKDMELNSIFSTANMTYSKLLKIASRLGISIKNEVFYNNYSIAKEDIKHLASNIFDSIKNVKKESSNVEINLVSNMYSEINEIAKIINDKVRKGYRYNDFVIYTSDIDEYSYIIKKVFYEYSIPLYLDIAQQINSNILVEYITKLIDIISYDFKNDNLFEILKLGLNNIAMEDICYIENYVLEFNINKYTWNKSFTLNNTKKEDIIYDLERINYIRNQILNLFGDLTIVSKGKYDVNQIIEKLYNHLIQNNVMTIFESNIKEMKNFNDPEIIYNASINEQVWDKICEVFDSICKTYVGESINIKEFRDIFEYGIKDAKIKSIPPTIDQVPILDINSSNSETKKYMFLIGANENKLPKKVDEDIFFSDLELDKLEYSGIKFKETSISKLNMQLYNIYKVLNNALEKLYIFVPVADSSGKSLRKSNILTYITELLDVQEKGNVTSEDDITKMELNDIYSNDLAFEYMIKNMEDLDSVESKHKLLGIYKYFQNEKSKDDLSYADILNYLKNDSNLKEDTLKRIYGDELNTSVSRLELFKRCPFSYYMNYGLKLKPRKIFNISSMDIGSFMHEVLERFSLYLLSNNIKWQEILIEGKEEWATVLENIIFEELDLSFAKQRQSVKYNILKQKLINTMKKVVVVIARSFNQSEFEPYGYEIEFKNGGLFAPIHVKLDSGKDMYLVGKIDRVDVLKNDEKIYARIVDYKSSSKDLSIDDIKEGLSLQLVTYLYAFIENVSTNDKVEVLPSGMLYFNLSDKLVDLKNYTKDTASIEKEVVRTLRMKGIFLKDTQIIKKMDNKIDSDERLIDISLRTINSDKSKRALEQEEYVELCKEAKDILKKIGNEVLIGNVKIEPNRKKDVCKYCNYSSICRKDICL